MHGKFAKVTSMMVAAVMVLSLAACGGGNKQTAQEKTATPEATAKANLETPKSTLKVGIFTVAGDKGSGFYKSEAKEDVVADALEKKTGVRFDKRVTSSGMKAIEKFSMLYASGELPEVLFGWQDSGDFNLKECVQKMLNEDMVWTFTDDELKSIAPNAYNAIGPVAYNFSRGIYGTDKNVGLLNRSFGWSKFMLDNFKWKAAKDLKLCNWSNNFAIRDDILKDIIPTAKTRKELEDILKAKGKLTWEDINIPELETYDGFVNFLKKVKDKYAAQGVIPFAPEKEVGNLFARIFLGGGLHGDYDAVGNQVLVDPVDKKDQFDKMIKDLNLMFNDGLLYKNFALDKEEQYKEKMNSGKFAVARGNFIDEANRALEAGKAPYKYRQAFVSYDTGDSVVQGAGGVDSSRAGFIYVINKKKLPKKEDAEKLLKFWDYLATYEGQQLINWGPKEAGLWEEKDGKRQFTSQYIRDILAVKAQEGNGKDMAYYGLALGGDKFFKDEYFIGRCMHDGITGPFIDETAVPDLWTAIVDASQVKASVQYDDNYAAWNGITKSNKAFWDNWEKSNDMVARAVMAKANEFDKKYQELWDHFNNAVKIQDYAKEQKTYLDFVKKYKDTYRFHPKADMGKVK